MGKNYKYLETHKILHLFTIALLSVIAYHNSFYNSFHFDDRYAILEDAAIKNIRNLPLIFSDIFNRPILRATFAINYYFGGLNVFGYHFLNLLFHIIVSIQVYFLASLLYKRFFSSENNPQTYALISALIFALHPLHTGSVTYIASRSAILAALFYLASFLLFLKTLSLKDKKRPLWYLLTCILFILSLGVKEVTVTLPMIIAIYAFISDSDSLLSYIKKYGIILSILFLILALYLLARLLTLSEIALLDVRIEEGILPRYPYFLTEINVIIFYYLKWLVFPFDGPHVDPDIPPETTIFDGSTILAFLIIAGLIAASLFGRKRWPIVSFGILWYFITLAPTSSFFPIGDVAVERHVYIPAIGFSLAAGYLLYRAKDRISLKILLPVYTALVTVFIYFTIAGNFIWKNELTLWGDAAKKAPLKIRVLNNRAWGYYLAGDLRTAEHYYKELLERFPEYPFGHNNLGLIYQNKGEIENAIKEYQMAAAIRPNIQLFRMNLGIAYDIAGLYDKAIAELRMAVKLNPANPEALVNLASTLAKDNKFQNAIQILNKAVEIDPANSMAYYILGYSYEMSGLLSEAINAYNKALKLNPDWELAKSRILGLKGKR
ncbi:MAG: hypothetical protein A3G39_11470 [Deltaproteobacteria bacterium RIFCSPLOWO2_12_FULL_43_16]|nr:MAG: hypothetical protein A2Z89_05110 [Deltaproteobacteria bacterium GWA2_43_19]OGQ10425.1 MAG: hypothetical protein A3D30_08815 [Deltaproteobacteria bacterium RIFCSPHIGHO2_02_FULL_43_33]OGQ58957.1 MAG: hypothetical protein A3G39_11470 [Deltaproteobacteria bacterium RIFCSPLOWO2_12_FULL_43_16]HBR16689.1 hypothetical protein [Deltaproteobacteria bacterium]